MQNAFVEGFNGRFRDECLNAHWFVGLADARGTVEAWRDDYNRTRPRSALRYRTPDEFRRDFDGRERPGPTSLDVGPAREPVAKELRQHAL